MRIALIDYHKGNITSVKRALDDAGADVAVTDDPGQVEMSDAIVLPGVGAFTDAMDTLDELGLTDVIKKRVNDGAPFLGICLGMHLMFDSGEEHAKCGIPTPGLGFIPGTVKKLPREGSDGGMFKIPHVGWNSIEPTEGGLSSKLLDGIDPGEFFYFTHSYASPQNPCTIAETTHSITFPSIVSKGNSYGVQFHPEKSSTAGQRLIANFVDLANASLGAC